MRTKDEIRFEQERLVRLHPMVAPKLTQYPNVDHIGVGVKEVGGELSNDLCFRVYVKKKLPLTELSKSDRIPKKIMGVKTDVIVKEEVEMVAWDSTQSRPLRGGIMIRNHRYDPEVVDRALLYVQGDKDTRGAGTLGLIVHHTGQNRVMGLTCQHVVDSAINSNTAVAFPGGVKIGQPRHIPVCCWCNYDQIGEVYTATKNATMDCALIDFESDLRSALNTPALINNIKDLGQVTGAAQAVCWERVRKRGAATQVTTGQVVDVLYEGSQILVTSLTADLFADFGDSGAVLVNDAMQVVGLLWGAQRRPVADTNDLPARSFTTSGVATHIGPLMTHLGITIAGAASPSATIPAANCGPSSAVPPPPSSSSSSSSSSSAVVIPSSSSSSAAPVITQLAEWKAWPGGQGDVNLNPKETFRAADFGFAGPCDWNVGNGGVPGLIVETNSTTATGRTSIKVRYNVQSPGTATGDTAWIECIQGGSGKRVRRTVFRVYIHSVNSNGPVHTDNALTFSFAGVGTDINNAGFNRPGDNAATRYAGKIEVRFSILPTNIPWATRGVRFRMNMVSAPVANAKGDLVAMRDNLFTDGFQNSGAPNRAITTQGWANDGQADPSDVQYPSVASPNFIFRLDAPGFAPTGLQQGFFRDHFREFIQFHNGTGWVRISYYANWYCNITAVLPSATPGAPNNVGFGHHAVNLPNTRPVVNAGVNQTVSTGALVQLNASATDADNDQIVRYRWRQIGGPAVVLSSTTARNPRFTAPGAPTVLTFEAVAVDNTNVTRFSPNTHESLPDTVTITVV